jgi:hypothetical protein
LEQMKDWSVLLVFGLGSFQNALANQISFEKGTIGMSREEVRQTFGDPAPEFAS